MQLCHGFLLNGRLNLFFYDPKFKKKLPYYDTFPLVLPLETYSDGLTIGLKIANECQKRGLIARALGNILILSPTLILNENEIRKIESILRESITETTKNLKNKF